MTYSGFLLRFLILPLLLLVALTYRDWRRLRHLPQSLGGAPAALTLVAHIVVALLYTTPWDNYLVATRVWWYDPALVIGITLGWVPLEEYGFFILQTLVTGLWLLFLARRLPQPTSQSSQPRLRTVTTALAGLAWLAAVLILATGWRPGTYLALELAWALPPIMVQLLFGADILWNQRRLVALALLPITLFLAVGDALAIGSGTWTIDPQQSLGLLLGNVLPLEELIFFLLTNTLVVFGVTLVLSTESHRRAGRLRLWLRRLAPSGRAGGRSQVGKQGIAHLEGES